MSETREQIQQRWLHSHEEDSATETVFRPATFSFPLSRGRTGFEFRADGSYIDIGISPADGPVEIAGQWLLDESGDLTLTCEARPGRPRRLRVVSCDADRLVLEKDRGSRLT